MNSLRSPPLIASVVPFGPMLIPGPDTAFDTISLAMTYILDAAPSTPAPTHQSPFHNADLTSSRALLRHAALLMIVLLAITVGLLVWHQFGMTRVIDLTNSSVHIRVEDDRSGGGESVASLDRNGKDIDFRCKISNKGQWPYCKIIFDFNDEDRGIDLSEFDSIVVEAGAPAKSATKLGFVIANWEDGLTQKDRWETYKINQIDGLDISSDAPYVIPLQWFAVPQWWKDMAKPRIEHSFVNFDKAMRLEILTSGGGDEDRVITLRSVRLVGKHISRSTLLSIIVAGWMSFAIGWVGVAHAALRSRLQASKKQVSLLAQINEALELEAKDLAGQAHTDPLTGVLNRQGLRAALMSTSALLAAPMSVIFVDIDYFKRINDQHGHGIGDEVLRQFAKIMASNIRSSDRLVRWGGEEFLIVCPITDATRAARLGELLRSALNRHVWPAGLNVTASFGIAQHQEGTEINSVIKAADDQLYRAKNQGRDQVCFPNE